MGFRQQVFCVRGTQPNAIVINRTFSLPIHHIIPKPILTYHTIYCTHKQPNSSTYNWYSVFDWLGVVTWTWRAFLMYCHYPYYLSHLLLSLVSTVSVFGSCMMWQTELVSLISLLTHSSTISLYRVANSYKNTWHDCCLWPLFLI